MQKKYVKKSYWVYVHSSGSVAGTGTLNVASGETASLPDLSLDLTL
jgi:hypothetical protein